MQYQVYRILCCALQLELVMEHVLFVALKDILTRYCQVSCYNPFSSWKVSMKRALQARNLLTASCLRLGLYLLQSKAHWTVAVNRKEEPEVFSSFCVVVVLVLTVALLNTQFLDIPWAPMNAMHFCCNKPLSCCNRCMNTSTTLVASVRSLKQIILRCLRMEFNSFSSFAASRETFM